MKKAILSAACFALVLLVAAEPGTLIKQRFSQTFPNATNIKWNDDTKGFYASFTQNGNFQKAFYDKEGNFVCSWKYSNGSDLPVNILMVLHKKFKNAKMIGATEYTTSESTRYNIKLSNIDKLYSLDISEDGNIIDQQKFHLQNFNDANSN